MTDEMALWFLVGLPIGYVIGQILILLWLTYQDKRDARKWAEIVGRE